ncbi:unnamed protein product [[Candida] boidinii]|nr:unnamed protein product [[Candida] boidinii]
MKKLEELRIKQENELKVQRKLKSNGDKHNISKTGNGRQLQTPNVTKNSNRDNYKPVNSRSTDSRQINSNSNSNSNKGGPKQRNFNQGTPEAISGRGNARLNNAKSGNGKPQQQHQQQYSHQQQHQQQQQQQQRGNPIRQVQQPPQVVNIDPEETRLNKINEVVKTTLPTIIYTRYL